MLYVFEKFNCLLADPNLKNFGTMFFSIHVNKKSRSSIPLLCLKSNFLNFLILTTRFSRNECLPRNLNFATNISTSDITDNAAFPSEIMKFSAISRVNNLIHVEKY